MDTNLLYALIGAPILRERSLARLAARCES
jgi:hypothetical protein